jgi:hypothetical protein
VITFTFHHLSSLAPGSNFYALQDGGTAPAPALFSPVAGWATATTGIPFGDAANSGTASQLAQGTERAMSTFVTVSAAHPDVPTNSVGNGWRTPTPIFGRFYAGAWTLPLRVRSQTAVMDGRFRARWRVFSSPNADGTGATELTSGPLLSPATTASLSTSADTVITTTWNAPQFDLATPNYLFFTVAIEITSAATISSARDVNLLVGSSIVTADFTVPVSGLGAPSRRASAQAGSLAAQQFQISGAGAQSRALGAGLGNVGILISGAGAQTRRQPAAAGVVAAQLRSISGAGGATRRTSGGFGLVKNAKWQAGHFAM